MIPLFASEAEIAAAIAKAEREFRDSPPTIRSRNPATAWVGFLGEAKLARWAGRAVRVDEVDGQEPGAPDLSVGGVLVDAKTLHRNVPPRPDYWGYAFRDQTERGWSSEVFFCSYESRGKRLFLCGGVRRQELLDRGRLFRRGELIPPGLRAREDVYALPYSAVEPPTAWLDRIIRTGVPALYAGRRR